ncbi:hypothetical protein ACFP3V_19710 [Streptacidiphilus monticola]|uniref:Integral membrane protein n=1 Tax=Streptacidiphilus monticola TaxID=2161674 RepID=A0ABW1G5I8_9ACTN
MPRGTYARARVVVVRDAAVRPLLWVGVVGVLAGLLIPSLTGRVRGLLLGCALLVLACAVAALGRSTWYRRRAAAAERAAFAVTLEPPHLTRLRLRRVSAWIVLVGCILVCGLGVVGGAAAGLLVLGWAAGLWLQTRVLARWERKHECLLWTPSEDGRRPRGPFVTTGPAADRVRPVVKAPS